VVTPIMVSIIRNDIRFGWCFMCLLFHVIVNGNGEMVS
jgi:hypothetical protein